MSRFTAEQIASMRTKQMNRREHRTCQNCSQQVFSNVGSFRTHVKFCTVERERRFWAQVDQSAGPDACWPWTGARFKKKNRQMGYGRFAGSGPWTYTHRAAWILTNGPVPAGKIIMHSCDNVICCNPRHLSQGTQLDNMRDMVAKGRQRPRGFHSGS